jgi:tetratricopeptide (TPR) repeat protein
MQSSQGVVRLCALRSLLRDQELNAEIAENNIAEYAENGSPKWVTSCVANDANANPRPETARKGATQCTIPFCPRVENGGKGGSLSSSARGKKTLVSCLFLVVATAAIYGQLAHHSFINYDDQDYVTRNAHVQAGLSWQTFTWALTATDADNWHPLTWISHALDFQLYGLNAPGHHLTSLFFHVLNVVILFLLLLRVTGAMGRSLLVAALFALHPLNVESVAWVAERKNVLSTLFFLLALGAYGWYARSPSLKRYPALAGLFVLGLASKPMVITLPFVLLLLDFWPLKRIQEWGQPSAISSKKRKNRGAEDLASAPESAFTEAPLSRLVLEKLPLLAFCVGSAVLTIVAQRGAIRSVDYLPVGLRLENVICAYAVYIWKAFLPVRLVPFYPYAEIAMWQLGLAALFLLAVSAAVWNQRFARRYLITGWLWYLGTLVPVIGLVQVGDQAVADRYAYVPLIGIFVMVVWRAADWADGKKISLSWRTAVVAIVLCALSFLTWRQVGYWRSDFDLWPHTLEASPDNPLGEQNFGDALLGDGRAEEALPFLEKAAKLNTRDPDRHANLGADLMLLGNLHDAVAEYQAAIPLTSNATLQARYYESLATLCDMLGDYLTMRDNYRQALKLDPQQGPGMIERISRDIADQPTGPRYLQLGVLLQETGKLSEAQAAYEQALKLDPTLQAAKQSLDSQAR